MILNISGKSVTAGRQATAGTPGVVDTVGKFATTPVANNGNNIRLIST
jgi:hypothetical protein